MSDKQQQLFKTRLVPGKEGSGNLFEEEFVEDDGPVECLGMTFENDEKRREYFLEKLREKLKDPEFRKIEGFPIGEDEGILALSDPPYYTACPNPFIEDFIQQYGKPYDPNVPYSREPFAADTGAGKTHPIYTAHSYHSKIPHLAIMPCILHYTEPEDIVLDGFSGSGMTGVAAQLCGEPESNFRGKLEQEWKDAGYSAPKWGAQRPVLIDLPLGKIGGSQVNRFQPGVFYIPQASTETTPSYILNGKYKRLLKMLNVCQLPTIRQCVLSTAFSLQSPIPDKSVDYIYTDPPFGDAIKYGDLNLLIEAWHNLFSRLEDEVLWDKLKNKSLSVYSDLMRRAFAEYYRVLKPGRWMTVVFHNSKNLVWTAIQEAIGNAGFVVADVRTLDRQQGSFNQVTAVGAVKQDLVISAYKPNGGLEERFKLEAGTEDGAWDFVRTHLKHLPVFVAKNGQAEVIAERQNYLLFDRMVAFHVQRGVTVPLSAAEFYAGLEQRFPPRDGMYFLPDQAAEYDKKRMTVREVLQLQLFVSDEASAIQWLKQQLTKKPQTAGEMKPQFMQEIGGWQKNEKMLDLDELLEQNFLRYDGKGEVPSQIHSYLSSNFQELRNLAKDDPALRAKGKDRWYVPDPNKAGDLEKLRERTLLREFDEYRESKQKRLKVFRLEAVRAGFKKAWQERDYATIIAVARKIPDKILQEDPKLLM